MQQPSFDDANSTEVREGSLIRFLLAAPTCTHMRVTGGKGLAWVQPSADRGKGTTGAYFLSTLRPPSSKIERNTKISEHTHTLRCF